MSKRVMHAVCMHMGKNGKEVYWGANGGMSGGGSEKSGFSGGMNGESSERSGFSGYERQVLRVCVVSTTRNGYDKWGYEWCRMGK